MPPSRIPLQHRYVLRLQAIVEELRAYQSEQDWFEFKINQADLRVIGETIAAVANTARLHDRECGYIVWGVDDTFHQIVGTEFDWNKTVGNQSFHFRLSQKLAPCPDLKFSEIVMSERRVVVLTVPAATDLAVSFDRVARIRIGNATPPLRDYPSIEKQLIAKLRPFVWEQGISSEFVTAEEIASLLDYQICFRRLETQEPTTLLGIVEKLAELGFVADGIGGRWNILNVGAILLARDLSLFPDLDRKALRIIQYTGTSKITARPEQFWLEGYASGFNRAVSFLEGILPAREVIVLERSAERSYPSEAIRELLANTLIHQDLTVTGTGPKVEVFSDRIEFTNPGESVTDWRKLFGAEPKSRNERLASLMRKMRLCEERGSGLRRTIGATNAAELLPPEFHSKDGFSKVLLHGHRMNFEKMDQNQKVRAIYYYAMLLWEQGRRLTNSLLRERFHMTGNATVKTSALLKASVDAGYLKLADALHPNSGYCPFWA